MKIYRSLALALLVSLGFKTADKWDAKKLSDKINKLNEQVDDDTKVDDEDQQKALAKILKAIAAAKPVEILADPAEEAEAEIEEAPVPAKKPAKAAAKPAPVAEEEVEIEAATAKPTPKKAATTAAPGGAGKTTVKPPKPAPAPKPPKTTTPGVRESRSRPYLAGIVIKKHTRAAGITEVMITELDAAYGKPNPAESLFCLRNAWHAIRGYVTKENEGDLDQATATTEE